MSAWQFVSPDGKVVVRGPFASAFSFHDGVANVRVGESWGSVGRDGAFVIEPIYDTLHPSHQRRAAFEVEHKWGYVDPTGEVVIEPRFLEAKNFNMGPTTIVRGESGWGAIRVDGSVVVPLEWDGIGVGPDGWIRVVKAGKVGFFDEQGAMVIAPQFRGVDHFHEDRAVVNVEGVLGYIDRRGEIVIPPNFASATDFSCGLALAQKEGRWGFIDASGAVVIPFDFSGATAFAKTSRGPLAFAWTTPTESGFCIDARGKRVSDVPIAFAKPFDGDTAIFAKASQGPYGLVDTSLKEILPCEYLSIDAVSGGHRKVGRAVKGITRYGFVDARGAVTCKPMFEEAHPFLEDFAAVKTEIEPVAVRVEAKPVTLGEEAPRLRLTHAQLRARTRFRTHPAIVDAVIAAGSDRAAIRKLLKDDAAMKELVHCGKFWLEALGPDAVTPLGVAIEVVVYPHTSAKAALLEALDAIDSMESVRTRARIFGNVDVALGVGRALRALAPIDGALRERAAQAFAKIEVAQPGAVHALLALLPPDEVGVVRATATNRGIDLDVAGESEIPPQLREHSKKKKLPDFWDASIFARPLLLGRKKALPIDAVTEIAIHLDAGDLDAVEIKRTCDAESLRDFAWSVFSAWEANHAPTKQKWAFTMLGDFGDDEIVARLAPMIAEWPGQSLHARAVMGLAVLGHIGTVSALRAVHKLSQRAKFGGLKGEAEHAIARIAKQRGLTSEELADQLVPDFDLDDDGSKLLDFGARTFRVGFDEALRPFVLAEGKRVADLPKPTKTDDKARATEAQAFWKNLKKEVRAIASLQIERLERAMALRRSWHLDSFRAHFIEHPLLQHLAKRVAWSAGDVTFRVAEDRTLANAKDEAITLAGETPIRIAHPIELGADAIAAWSKIFGEYEIVQPFEQLQRAIHTMTKEEETTRKLRRFENVEVRGGALVGLLTHGWSRGAVEDHGIYHEISHPLVTLRFQPGLAIGTSANPNQKLDAMDLTSGPIDPIAFSELVHTLERVKRTE